MEVLRLALPFLLLNYFLKIIRSNMSIVVVHKVATFFYIVTKWLTLCEYYLKVLSLRVLCGGKNRESLDAVIHV